jgi:hypothetical protein
MDGERASAKIEKSIESNKLFGKKNNNIVVFLINSLYDRMNQVRKGQ